MRLPIGLRTRFFLYSNTLIVGTMLLVVTIWVRHERSTWLEAIGRRGRSIAVALAVPITETLMYEDIGLLADVGLIENSIREVIADNRDIMRYVVVTDTAGVVTHSNRWELLGEVFERGVIDAAGDQAIQEQTLESEDEGRLLEIRLPLNISSKSWGGLAIAVDLRSVELKTNLVIRRAFLVAFILIVVNSTFTAMYVETLIRPILKLNETMKRAGRGNLHVRAPQGSGGEVGELSGAFNRMMDELSEVRDRERTQRAQLVHTEKMVAVGTLAAGVAHEVRNPLAGVMGCLENLRSKPEDTERMRRYLDLIQDGLERIEYTIDNLLGFSRSREMQPEPTSLAHNLKHVVELASYQLRKAGVEVVFELEGEDETVVMGDHFQMEQLFLNLVLNAIKAMSDGDGVLTLRAKSGKGKVIVEVEDTGEGIQDEIRDRIFDPFFTTRTVGKGTGLGLTVSDSIVAAHAGVIEVESTIGEGTVFRVILPSAKTGKGRDG